MTIIVLVITLFLSNGKVVVQAAPFDDDMTFCKTAGETLAQKYQDQKVKDEAGETITILDAQYKCLPEERSYHA